MLYSIAIYFLAAVFAQNPAGTIIAEDAAGTPCPAGIFCGSGGFCDMASGDSGICVLCDDVTNMCANFGLSTEGRAVCEEFCETEECPCDVDAHCFGGTCHSCSVLREKGDAGQGCLALAKSAPPIENLESTRTNVVTCLVRCFPDGLNGAYLTAEGPAVSDLVPKIAANVFREGESCATGTPPPNHESMKMYCEASTEKTQLWLNKDDIPCQEAYCGHGDNDFEDQDECYIRVANQYGFCPITDLEDVLSNEVVLPGMCIDGFCVYTTSSECPGGGVPSDFGECGGRVVAQDDRKKFDGEWCPQGGDADTCETLGRKWKSVMCFSFGEPAGTRIDETTQQAVTYSNFTTRYHDTSDQTPDEFACLNGGDTSGVDCDSVSENIGGRCIIGHGDEDCAIAQDGYFKYREANIAYLTGESETEIVTLLIIASMTKTLTPILKCPQGGECAGSINCQMSGAIPCGGQYLTCPPTSSPTQEPTSEPTSSPTPATSHGDPIIWTFDGECYDLNIDGHYTASAHPDYDHEVKISIYNDYMREISVVHKSGRVMLSINNLGEVMNSDYPYFFSEETKECPEDVKDCSGTYKEFAFDAQSFRYTVQPLLHDYLDPALKEGEVGHHLDIYPRPYDSFHAKKEQYTGLYFENPLPDETRYCAGGAPRQRQHKDEL